MPFYHEKFDKEQNGGQMDAAAEPDRQYDPRGEQPDSYQNQVYKNRLREAGIGLPSNMQDKED